MFENKDCNFFNFFFGEIPDKTKIDVNFVYVKKKNNKTCDNFKERKKIPKKICIESFFEKNFNVCKINEELFEINKIKE